VGVYAYRDKKVVGVFVRFSLRRFTMDIPNSIQKIKGRIKPTQLQLLCVGHTINFEFFDFDIKIKELQDLENKYEYFDVIHHDTKVNLVLIQKIFKQ
jgi:hypothetical protein